jgi:hypothetical protein
MENEPRFDLESALARWRQTLGHSPSLRDRDIHELEAHLRDSIQGLETKGLGIGEAFLIAARRVGSTRELEREFGKANPRRLWLDRALWLLLGFMVFEWIIACGMAVSRYIGNALLAQGAGAQQIGFLSQLLTATIEIGLALLFWRRITRRQAPVGRWLGDCLRRPWLPALGLVVLNYYRWPLLDGLMGLATPVTNAILNVVPPWTSAFAGARSPMETQTLMAWQHWGTEVRFLFYLIGFVYLARVYARMTGEISPARGAMAPEKPAAMETPEVPALERIGLSKPEAYFLIHRRTLERTTASPTDTASWPQVWAERGLWMLTGTFLARALWAFQDLLQLGAAFLLSGLWLNGQVAGFLTLILQAFVLWALSTHLWRWVTRGEGLCRRLGGLILTRPALSMLGVLGAGFALQSLVIELGRTYSETISALNVPTGDTFMHWYNGNHELWYNIVPVILVFWLARRQWQENLIEPSKPES